MIKTTPGAGAVGPVASHGLAASVAQRPAPSGASVLDPTCPAEGLDSLDRRPPTRCSRSHTRGARRARSRRVYPSHSQRSAHSCRSLFSIRHSRAPRPARIADVSRLLLEPRAPSSRTPRRREAASAQRAAACIGSRTAHRESRRGCPHWEHHGRNTVQIARPYFMCTLNVPSRTAPVAAWLRPMTASASGAAAHTRHGILWRADHTCPRRDAVPFARVPSGRLKHRAHVVEACKPRARPALLSRPAGPRDAAIV